MNSFAGSTRQACRFALMPASAWFAGCVLVPPQVPPAPSPNEACQAVIESLTAAVPPGESLAELEARGIRVRTPLSFAPGTAPRPQQPSGAAVQLLIAPDGTVAPGSPRTLKSVGDTQLSQSMEGAALSMSFEFDAGARPATPIPYTTIYAVCLRQ